VRRNILMCEEQTGEGLRRQGKEEEGTVIMDERNGNGNSNDVVFVLFDIDRIRGIFAVRHTNE